MVLVPDISWTPNRPLTLSPSGGYGPLHIRRTTRHSGLKSVPIDTLILVSPDDPNWDARGEVLARERLRTSRDPRVIQVKDYP